IASLPAHAGTAEPLRVSPPEAVAYPLELLLKLRRMALASGIAAVLAGGDDAAQESLHVRLGHGDLREGAVNALDGTCEAIVDICLSCDPGIQALVAFIQFDD